jgi:hypothetical protein
VPESHAADYRASTGGDRLALFFPTRGGLAANRKRGLHLTSGHILAYQATCRTEHVVHRLHQRDTDTEYQSADERECEEHMKYALAAILLLAGIARADSIEQVVFIQPDGTQLIDASYIETVVDGNGSASGLIDMSILQNVGTPTDWEDTTFQELPINGGLIDLGAQYPIIFEDTLASGMLGMESQLLTQQEAAGATCTQDVSTGPNFFGWLMQGPSYGNECLTPLNVGAIATPEPGTAFLLILGVFLLIAWRVRPRRLPVRRNIPLNGKGVYR